MDQAIYPTQTRRLKLRGGHPPVQTKRSSVSVNRAPSAKRLRLSHSSASVSRSTDSTATEADEETNRAEQTAAPRTSGHLDVNQQSHNEEVSSSQDVLVTSSTASTRSANDTRGLRKSLTPPQDRAWNKVVRSIQSTVKTVELHEDSWFKSTCTFTALVGSSKSSMAAQKSYNSFEAIEFELANTFVQVEENIHQCQIFKKLLAYTVNTLWAGKHLDGRKEVQKLRKYGRTARNFVHAANNNPSILLFVPSSWWVLKLSCLSLMLTSSKDDEQYGERGSSQSAKSQPIR